MLHSQRTLRCGVHELDLSRPIIMGILNVTPDSFSDGGRWFDAQRALDRARQMIEEGASIIDVGGESTRPGAQPVAESEELRRVVPLVETLAAELAAPISVDTSKPAVMTAAAAAGAGMINDVYALRQPGALAAVAATDLPVCLMHMQGQPRTMQQQPSYENVVTEVAEFLSQRVAACEEAGIQRQRLLLDPGFGFGKTLAHNLQLLAGLQHLTSLGLPLLAGISRKRMIGELTGREVDQRVHGSVAAALIAARNGAAILRVHDVAATRDALAIYNAVENPGQYSA
ncbi:MAG: dihydropteroate synthase [Wenzhouxiangellaceae bacterium]